MQNPIRIQLGGMLRAIREARGLSRGEVAKFLGISYAYLANIEGGQRPLPLHLCEGLEKVLDVPSLSVQNPARLANLQGELSPDTLKLFTGFIDELTTAVLRSLPDAVSKVYFLNFVQGANGNSQHENDFITELHTESTQRLLRAIERLDVQDIELLTQFARIMSKRKN